MLPADLLLGEVKRGHLTDLGLKLKAKGLAAGTVNKTMSAVTTALRLAATNEHIPSDHRSRLRPRRSNAPSRGGSAHRCLLGRQPL